MEDRLEPGRRRVALTARAAVLACTAILAAGAPACGGDDDNGEIPDGAVAVVGDRTVSEEAVDSQVAAIRRAQTGGAAARPDRKKLEQQALAVLLQREWLQQEAERRGVEVNDADVRRRWRAAVRDQFPTKKALQAFLGRQTEADVIGQLRLQALSEAIEQDIRGKAKGNPEQAVKRFRKQFNRRQQQATHCQEGYTAAGCDTP